jgi:FkbM family methyltransferase
LIQKQIHINGRSFLICGHQGDPYFEGQPSDLVADDLVVLFTTVYLSTDAVVFDVGANIGLTTAIFAQFAPDGKIHSFEPSPEAFPCLEETVRVNGFTNVVLHQLGLGAVPGKLSFVDDPNSASASHLAIDDTGRRGTSLTVDVETVDGIVERDRIDRLDLIKIDVEGFDLDVVEGAVTTIETLKPVCIIEFNSFTLQAFRNRSPREVLEALLSIFDSVYFRVRTTGELLQLDSGERLIEFLHMNLAGSGCVDDLICLSRPGGIEGLMKSPTGQLRDERRRTVGLEDQLANTARDVSDLAARLAEAQQELADTQHVFADTQQQLADTQQQLADTQQQLADTQQQLADTQQELADTQQGLADAQLRIDELINSTSWRATAPFRAVTRAIPKAP